MNRSCTIRNGTASRARWAKSLSGNAVSGSLPMTYSALICAADAAFQNAARVQARLGGKRRAPHLFIRRRRAVADFRQRGQAVRQDAHLDRAPGVDVRQQHIQFRAGSLAGGVQEVDVGLRQRVPGQNDGSRPGGDGVGDGLGARIVIAEILRAVLGDGFVDAQPEHGQVVVDLRPDGDDLAWLRRLRQCWSASAERERRPCGGQCCSCRARCGTGAGTGTGLRWSSATSRCRRRCSGPPPPRLSDPWRRRAGRRPRSCGAVCDA